MGHCFEFLECFEVHLGVPARGGRVLVQQLSGIDVVRLVFDRHEEIKIVENALEMVPQLLPVPPKNAALPVIDVHQPNGLLEQHLVGFIARDAHDPTARVVQQFVRQEQAVLVLVYRRGLRRELLHRKKNDRLQDSNWVVLIKKWRCSHKRHHA